MSDQQFRLLMLALLVGFGGLFAYALFGASGLLAVIAVWLVYEAWGVIQLVINPPPLVRAIRGIIKEIEGARQAEKRND